MSDNPEQPATSSLSDGSAAVFRALADTVYACEDFSEVYEAVSSATPRLVTGCDHASLMLLRNGRPVTVAASDDVARRVDELEREFGEGPCVDAVTDESAYIDADLTASSPWPGLAARVLEETPVRGMAGFRLVVEAKKSGALNLFSDTPGRLTDASVNQAIVLTSFVSVALIAAQQKQTAVSLRDGLTSNREIGKAVGLMMAFHKVTDEQAFELLRKTSQDMNMKVAEVARQVVQHHNSRG